MHSGIHLVVEGLDFPCGLLLEIGQDGFLLDLLEKPENEFGEKLSFILIFDHHSFLIVLHEEECRPHALRHPQFSHKEMEIDVLFPQSFDLDSLWPQDNLLVNSVVVLLVHNGIDDILMNQAGKATEKPEFLGLFFIFDKPYRQGGSVVLRKVDGFLAQVSHHWLLQEVQRDRKGGERFFVSNLEKQTPLVIGVKHHQIGILLILEVLKLLAEPRKEPESALIQSEVFLYVWSQEELIFVVIFQLFPLLPLLGEYHHRVARIDFSEKGSNAHYERLEGLKEDVLDPLVDLEDVGFSFKLEVVSSPKDLHRRSEVFGFGTMSLESRGVLGTHEEDKLQLRMCFPVNLSESLELQQEVISLSIPKNQEDSRGKKFLEGRELFIGGKEDVLWNETGR